MKSKSFMTIRKVFISTILPLVVVSFVYLLFNVIFTNNIWQQVLTPEKPDEIIIQGESPIYEYVAETVRLNVLSGKNPFASTQSLLYPFGWNFALEDIAPINGLYFLLLRPFLQIHQSMMLIIVINIFLSNISMYLLLRFLNIRKDISFLGGFMYGFTPWLALRIGAHPSYTALYVFPVITYCLLYLITSKKNKTISAVFLGFFLALTLLTNLYFTVMMVMLGIVAALIFFLTERKLILSIIKKHALYFLISSITAIIILIPWIIASYKSVLFTQYTKPTSLVDVIAFSADLFNIIIPSYVNPFYKPFIQFLPSIFPHLHRGLFETFIYPGIIIIVGYATLFYYWKSQEKIVKILVIISICMLIFVLGPYLQVYGNNLQIPLPYLALHYIPYFQLARVPGRFIIIFIFLACIVVAMSLNAVTNKLKKKHQIIIFILVFLIALIDQAYQGGSAVRVAIPNKIFSFLEAEKKGHKFPVLNIPFTIRDGLKSLGYYHGVWFPRVTLQFSQPIFSIYAGRINDGTFQYYKYNPLFNLLDRSINEPTSLKQSINSEILKNADRTINFLDIDYVMIKTQEDYSPYIRKIFLQLNYRDILVDKNYVLMHKKNVIQDFFPNTLHSVEDVIFYAEGWSRPLGTGRWVNGNVATIIFKLKNPRPVFMNFRAKTADKHQNVSVYINKKKVNQFTMTPGFKNYHLPFISHTKTGLNTITLRFSDTIEPAKVISQSKDRRSLAAFFTDLTIQDKEKMIVAPKEEKLAINFDQSDEPFLLEGWSDYEEGARWVEGKTAKVQFNVNKSKPRRLIISGEVLFKPQITKIYINDKYIGEIQFDTGKINEYSIDAQNTIKKGNNIITLQFTYAHRVGQLTGNTNDIRNLSLYAKSILLK